MDVLSITLSYNTSTLFNLELYNYIEAIGCFSGHDCLTLYQPMTVMSSESHKPIRMNRYGGFNNPLHRPCSSQMSPEDTIIYMRFHISRSYGLVKVDSCSLPTSAAAIYLPGSYPKEATTLRYNVWGYGSS